MTPAALRALLRPATSPSSDVKSLTFISGLRLAAGIFQFSTVLYITGYLSLGELGDYSLFVIILGYFTQLTGFSFSTFLIRELAAHERGAWPALLLQQLRFQSWSYALALAIGAAGVLAGAAPPGYAVAFGVLLGLALINSAFENYMVGTGHPLPAALNVLLRAGWIVPLATVSLLGWVQPSLTAVFIAWTAGEVLATLALLAQIVARGLFPTAVAPADRAWIARGFRVGVGYTVLAVLLLVTMSVQRVVLGHYHAQELVGIFHFYFVVSVFIPNLLEASLYALILPRLVRRNQVEGKGRLLTPDPKLFLLLLGLGGAAVAAVAVALSFVLPWLGKPELLAYRYLLAFTGPWALFYTGSRVFHYQLYAAHRDTAMLAACAAACAVACVASLILVPAGGLRGAATALVISGAALALAFATPFFMMASAADARPNPRRL